MTRVTRLFCLPHAGGGPLAYRPWVAALAPATLVHPLLPPGRERRWDEPAPTRMDALVDDLDAQVRAAEADGLPCAFFGHSLGAAVAYELCLRRVADGRPAPVRLFVSGRRAPHLPSRHAPAHDLDRAGLVAYLRRLNGVPAEVLANADLLDAFLPAVRADLRVNESYDPPRRPPLPVPVSALLGESDPAADVREMLCWRDVTARGFSLRVFPGDHFYLRGGRPDVVAAVRDDLASTEPEGRRPWPSASSR